jgi:hypothetical protein
VESGHAPTTPMAHGLWQCCRALLDFVTWPMYRWVAVSEDAAQIMFFLSVSLFILRSQYNNNGTCFSLLDCFNSGT